MTFGTSKNTMQLILHFGYLGIQELQSGEEILGVDTCNVLLLFVFKKANL